MKIAIIAAMTRDRAIGKDGKLPWKIKEDMQKFKSTTIGNTVIMGRKTYESIGRALPNRNNIVVSKSMQTGLDGIVVCQSIDEALVHAQTHNKDIFFIGGAAIYAEAIAKAQRMYISHVKQDYVGDVFFPEIDRNIWHKTSSEEHEEFTFTIYDRIPRVD